MRLNFFEKKMQNWWEKTRHLNLQLKACRLSRKTVLLKLKKEMCLNRNYHQLTATSWSICKRELKDKCRSLKSNELKTRLWNTAKKILRVNFKRLKRDSWKQLIWNQLKFRLWIQVFKTYKETSIFRNTKKTQFLKKWEISKFKTFAWKTFLKKIQNFRNLKNPSKESRQYLSIKTTLMWLSRPLKCT